MSAHVFRFRPRYRLVPWLVFTLGVVLVVLGLMAQGSERTFAIAAGALGPVLALLYLGSPAWKLVVEVDDETLTVRRGDDVRFRMPWGEVAKVIAMPAHKTCFVDGGTSERSLLVPGPGVPAPYRIEGREALYDFIVAHVAADKIESRSV